MSDYGKRNGNEFIEGEYEILEARDVDNEYHHHYAPEFFETNPYPPYVTYVLLGLNIAAFLLMSLTGLLFGWNLNEQLFVFGAKENYMIAYGQYWRLFTAMFLHIGIIHLFFNSYALYIYGPIVEKLYGRLKFAIVYLVSGLFGSLLSYLFSPNPAAGASGAIFGLMGSLLYFRQRKKSVFQRAFGPQLFIIIGLNLFYGFSQPGIDNWGHIGGLVGGFLLGNAVGLYKEKYISAKKVAIWLLAAAVFVIGLLLGKQKYTII